ncbi:UNVERIFIED_CONTAM: hypothetical protein HDU68_007713, partial [Siphonaria sp. JEL0065]
MSSKPNNVLSESDLAIYKEALRLASTTTDPQTTPYKSQYECQTLLTRLLSTSAIEATTNQANDSLRKPLLNYHLAKSRLKTQSPQAESLAILLADVIPQLEAHQLLSDCIVPLLDAYVIVSVVLVDFGRVGEALGWLVKGEEVYKRFMRQDSGGGQVVIRDYLNGEDDDGGVDALENGYTVLGYTLAQVYGALGDAEKSAEFCLRTLQRQV